MGRTHYIINKILEYLILVIAVLGLTGFILEFNAANYLLLPLFVLIQVIRYFNKKHKWGLNEIHFSLLMVSMYLHIFGDNVFRIYYVFSSYDKILHFMNPLIATYIIADSKILTKYKYLTIFIVLGCSGFFEILEFFADMVFGSLLQGVFLTNQGSELMSPLEDTMYDMFIGLGGSIIGYLFYIMKNNFKAMKK